MACRDRSKEKATACGLMSGGGGDGWRGDVGGGGCARTGVGERRKRRKRWNEEGVKGGNDENERM